MTREIIDDSRPFQIPSLLAVKVNCPDTIKRLDYGLNKFDLFFENRAKGLEPSKAMAETEKELKKRGIIRLLKPIRRPELTAKEKAYRAMLDREIANMEALGSKIATPLGNQLSLNL